MRRDLDVLAAGEALWDLETGASFAEARSLAISPGGAAVNTAIHLAHLGLRAGVAATVGADPLGRALKRRIEAEGVDASAMIEAPPRTGLCLFSRLEGRPEVVSYRDPAAPHAPIPEDAAAKVLLLTGLLPSAAQATLFEDAAARMKDAGATVVIDINARPRMWSGVHDALALVTPLLAAADVVKASEDDLRSLGLEGASDRILEVLRPDAVLVLTAGPGPARAIGAFGEVVIAPEAQDGFKESGAGDAFTAGMIAARLAEGSWESAIARGHEVARARRG